MRFYLIQNQIPPVHSCVMPIEFIILLYLKQKFPNWDPGFAARKM